MLDNRHWKRVSYSFLSLFDLMIIVSTLFQHTFYCNFRTVYSEQFKGLWNVELCVPFTNWRCSQHFILSSRSVKSIYEPQSKNWTVCTKMNSHILIFRYTRMMEIWNEVNELSIYISISFNPIEEGTRVIRINYQIFFCKRRLKKLRFQKVKQELFSWKNGTTCCCCRRPFIETSWAWPTPSRREMMLLH